MKIYRNSRSAFTLVELIVSSALIVAILGLLLTSVDQTRRVVSSTTSRVAQFQAARAAFDAMTRNLSQATLNTYWDVDTDPTSGNPTGYRRQSDLHFLIRKSAKPLEVDQLFAIPTSNAQEKKDALDDTIYPTHSVFFQAPIGFTALLENQSAIPNPNPAPRQYRALSNMLSAVGYYIMWGDDKDLPKFICGSPKTKPDESLVPRRYRYRLKEVIQPGEGMLVYDNKNYTNIAFDTNGNLDPSVPSVKSPYAFPTDWVRVALGKKEYPALPGQLAEKIGIKADPDNGNRKVKDSSRTLAENIVALIILPKVSEKDRSAPDALNDLTDNFEYDSRPLEAFDSQAKVLPSNSKLKNLANVLKPKQLKQLHQLPPILQVTMVAIDEPSAVKLHDYSKSKQAGGIYPPPEWCKDMFNTVTTVAAFQRELGDPSGPDTLSLISKVGNVDGKHPTPKMNYRVFTTDVILRNSKWSK